MPAVKKTKENDDSEYCCICGLHISIINDLRKYFKKPIRLLEYVPGFGTMCTECLAKLKDQMFYEFTRNLQSKEIVRRMTRAAMEVENNVDHALRAKYCTMVNIRDDFSDVLVDLQKNCHTEHDLMDELNAVASRLSAKYNTSVQVAINRFAKDDYITMEIRLLIFVESNHAEVVSVTLGMKKTPRADEEDIIDDDDEEMLT